MFWPVVVALSALFLVKRVLGFLRARRDYGHLPHVDALFEPVSLVGGLLPTSSWNLGLKFPFVRRKTLYRDKPNKTFVVNPLLVGKPIVYTCSIPAFKQILASGSPFRKPITSKQYLDFLGENVITADGDIWRRHRRITAPAFNQSAYENVWNTTIGVYEDMLHQEGWGTADEAHTPDINVLTHKLAMFIIAICGFGIPMSWQEPKRDKNGRLSTQEMISEVATGILIRSRAPGWLYKLGFEKLTAIDDAYKSFVTFMHERIMEREAEITKLRAADIGGTDVTDIVPDVFGRLVAARLSEGKYVLSDDEIIGNCFVLMFAGHETTANTLSIAIVMLALYQDVQEKLYESIKNTLGDRDPTFDDYDSLEDVLACFYEAARMYPAGFMLMREVIEDTVLALPRQNDERKVDKIPLKKGTEVVMDYISLGYDEDSFPDSDAFNPSRWTKSVKRSAPDTDALERARKNEAPIPISTSAASTLDGFLGFSFGPRTCLGHKFAKVEAVAFLTRLLKEWRVEVYLKDGETREQWRTRMMDPKIQIALAVEKVPLKLVRREKKGHT